MSTNRFLRARIDPARLSAHVAAKWSSEVLAEGFVPYPKRLIRSAPHLFKGEEGVELLTALLAIVDFRKPKPLVGAPSLEYLAFTAGMDTRRFQTLLERLEELSLVSVRFVGKAEDRRLAISLDGIMEQICDLTESQRDPDS